MRFAFTVLLLSAFPLRAADDPLALKKIKYEDLGKFVAANKGKVIVVDFWTSICIPCKEGLQHLVGAHARLKGQGLVAVTVSLDDPADADAVAAAQKFLREKKIALTNFLLDETLEVWAEKLKISAVPCVYVFNRAGQIEEKYNKKPEPAAFDALIEKLLKEKTPQ